MPDLGATATAGIGGNRVRAGIEIQHLAALGIILAVLAWAAYQYATTRISENADFTAPPVQDADERDTGMATALATLNPLDGSVKHQMVMLPHQHYQGYVYLPHRYPRTVAGELTNTIHHGWSSMRLPACDDISAWIGNPPSEVAW